MVTKYLNELKERGNFSLSYLVKATEFSESTIRKILSGETANPGVDTVVALVAAMGGRMSDLDRESAGKEEQIRINATIAMKELYESRIAEIKAASEARLNAAEKDKRFLKTVTCCLGGFLLLMLLVDVVFGSVGWIRY